VKEWIFEPSLPLDFTVFPREKDMSVSALRAAWNFFLRLWLKIYFRLEIVGKERIPTKQSYVLIANHSSHLDAICLLAAIPWRQIHGTFAAAAKDYFFSSFFRSLFSAVFLNALPFERKKGPKETLELCADALQAAGNGLILFPEGTRSIDGKMGPFKSGIGYLTASTERLVVPAYIEGAHQAWPKGSHFPLPKKITIRIGEPLDVSKTPRTKEGFIEIAEEAKGAVQRLGNLCS
jgi:1-acyl-sn-glycerol-3-phosphate acyltransferase